jgi:excisionase family DNA binding protein
LKAITITKKELAERFGVSLTTVNEWIAANRIAYLKIGKIVKFTENHIQAFETTHTIKAVA